MKQAESKPLKVLIRVKKDQAGNLLCYIVRAFDKRKNDRHVK